MSAPKGLSSLTEQPGKQSLKEQKCSVFLEHASIHEMHCTWSWDVEVLLENNDPIQIAPIP